MKQSALQENIKRLFAENDELNRQLEAARAAGSNGAVNTDAAHSEELEAERGRVEELHRGVKEKEELLKKREERVRADEEALQSRSVALEQREKAVAERSLALEVREDTVDGDEVAPSDTGDSDDSAASPAAQHSLLSTK